MTTPSNRLDFEVKDDARLALDERLWTGTRRSTRPAWARLEAWRSAGGAASSLERHRVAPKAHA